MFLTKNKKGVETKDFIPF